MGPDVLLVSSADEVAKDVYTVLVANGLLRRGPVAADLHVRDVGRHRRVRAARPPVPRSGDHRGDAQDRRLGVRWRSRCWGVGPRSREPAARARVSSSRRGDTHVWVDAGNGTFSNLQKHISYRDVDALVITHGHSDHIADVMPLMYALGFDPEQRPDLGPRLRAVRHRTDARVAARREVARDVQDGVRLPADHRARSRSVRSGSIRSRRSTRPSRSACAMQPTTAGGGVHVRYGAVPGARRPLAGTPTC